MYVCIITHREHGCEDGYVCVYVCMYVFIESRIESMVAKIDMYVCIHAYIYVIVCIHTYTHMNQGISIEELQEVVQACCSIGS